MNHKDYVDQLHDAIVEMRRLYEHLTVKPDTNGNFYVSSHRVEFKDGVGSFMGTPPNFRSCDPLECIVETLKMWKAIRPPAFLYVDNRRVLWTDNEWIFIDPKPKEKHEDAAL